MELNIKICLDNEAFEQGEEVGVCLSQVTNFVYNFRQTKTLYDYCYIFDSNGNKVGKAEIE